MAERTIKNFATPDDLLRLPMMTAQLVELGEVTLSKLVSEPEPGAKPDRRSLEACSLARSIDPLVALPVQRQAEGVGEREYLHIGKRG